ncbi:MAG: AAA family ATPase, partial [Candidatus Aenigmatarchaeota archaeon]
MAVIEKIVMHNFKSFKKADCILGNGIIEITGPNGSGKSNIVDAIKFCLGEMNMKSLRAKSIKDLINEDANIASVILKFSNPNIEIKRIMNREGKVIYRINEEKVRRSDVINLLYTIGLDPSFYNIIPQGQVQKIVEMDPKKRRELIDSLSGIGEYEEKKKEALRELETVQQRINEAQLVLGERTAYLDSLQKEKEIAEQYMKAKEMFTLCRISILKKELISYENELKFNNEKRITLSEEIKKTANLINQIESELKIIEEKKLKYINKIQDITKKEEFNKEFANANAELKVVENQIEYLEKNKNYTDNEIKEINKQIKNYEEQNENLKKQITEITNSLKNLESSLAQNINEKKFFEEHEKIKNELIKLDYSIGNLLNNKSTIQTELGILIEKINNIKNEIKDIEEFINHGKVKAQNNAEKTKNQLLDEKNSIENKIKNLFQEEKNLN